MDNYTFFQQYSRQYSKNESITFDWLCKHIGWPFTIPKTIIDLVHLEAVFDVLDLYLWFRFVLFSNLLFEMLANIIFDFVWFCSYRFTDLFPEANLVRDMQAELDDIIEQGVVQITRLLKNSESSSPNSESIEEDFNVARHKHNYMRGTFENCDI